MTALKVSARQLSSLVLEAMRIDRRTGLELDELTVRDVMLLTRSSLRLREAIDLIDDVARRAPSGSNAKRDLSQALMQLNSAADIIGAAR